MAGTKYNAITTKNACEKHIDGSFMYTSYLELYFSKDSVTTYNFRRISTDNYKEKQNLSTVTYRYKVKKGIVIIDLFNLKLQFENSALVEVNTENKPNRLVFYKID